MSAAFVFTDLAVFAAVVFFESAFASANSFADLAFLDFEFDFLSELATFSSSLFFVDFFESHPLAYAHPPRFAIIAATSNKPKG